MTAVFVLSTFFIACSAATRTPSMEEEETVTVSMIFKRVEGSLRKGLVSSNDFLDIVLLYHLSSCHRIALQVDSVKWIPAYAGMTSWTNSG